jgi:rhodanese-related sulfurtransferase
MQQFLEFVSQQWALIGALIACAVMLMMYESRRAGQTITPQQVANLVNRDGGIVVDLRDNAEFRKGHIVNALSMPYVDAPKRLIELESHKQQPVILVCKMGQHSSEIGKQLGNLGFTQVYRLSGGILDWQAAQMPLVKA